MHKQENKFPFANGYLALYSPKILLIYQPSIISFVFHPDEWKLIQERQIMDTAVHHFHIPVMGLGFTIDSPIRVAPFGISSAISLSDDFLIEKVRKHHAKKFQLPYKEISRKEPDARAKRITEYLNLVHEIVSLRIEEIKKQTFAPHTEKTKYFQLLPDDSPLKTAYQKLLTMKDTLEKSKLAEKLTAMIKPGEIDVNIMAKIDNRNVDQNGNLLPEEFSDAKAALRGFSKSCLGSSVILSAGFNRGLCSYFANFQDFYRDASGSFRKKITLKVSDFRSALIQGKVLASKGLEVSEFRIESGLNCGGHAFASQGRLLPALLQEFKDKKAELSKQFKPVVQEFYKTMGWEYPESAVSEQPLITVQGGIATAKEAARLTNDYGCHSIGWGTPFLLVPEATCVDTETRELLAKAKKADQYLSDASPMGVPFNNLHGTSSETWTAERVPTLKPGSACPKGFLKTTAEFNNKPLCLAATEFQKQKIAELQASGTCPEKIDAQLELLSQKVCLCDHLSNGALVELGIANSLNKPKAVCPGPNIAWFNREYSLQEMVDHIYGRIDSLVPEDRPHMFATEVELYVTYFSKLLNRMEMDTANMNYLKVFKENLEADFNYILEQNAQQPYDERGPEVLADFIQSERQRLNELCVMKIGLAAG
jgi:hypothetical protein